MGFCEARADANVPPKTVLGKISVVRFVQLNPSKNESQGTAHGAGKEREKRLDERWLPAEFSEIVGPEAGHQDERQRRSENLVCADPDARQVPHRSYA